MAKPVGRLLVQIGADVGGLRRGGRRAESTLQSLSRYAQSTSKRMLRLSAAASALGSVMGGYLVTQGMQQVTTQQRIASSLNTTQREVAGLTAAFKTYGLQTDDISDALGTLADRAQDAASGQQSMADDFSMVGLEIDDLRSKKPSELFRDFANAISDVDDPSTRAAAVVRTFGDDLGRRLLPLLMQGEEALDGFATRAGQLGMAISDIDAAKVEEAQRSFRELGLAVDGISTQLSVELAPTIKAVAETMANQFVGAGETMQDAISEAVDVGVEGMADILDAVGAAVGFIERNPMMMQFGVLGYMILGKRGLAIGAAVGAIVEGVQKQIRRLSDDSTVNDLLERRADLEREINQLSASDGSDQDERARRRAQATIDRRRRELEVVEEQISTHEDLRDVDIDLAQTTDALYEKLMDQGVVDSQNALADGIRNVADAMRESRNVISGPETLPNAQAGNGEGGPADQAARMTEAEREELEKRLENLREYLMTRRESELADYEMRMETLRNAKENELITEDEFRQRKEDLEEKHQKRLTEIEKDGLSDREKFERASMIKRVDTVSGQLAQMTSDVARENEAMFRINQAASIANAITSAWEGYNKALAAYPPPLSYAMAGAQLAAGFSAVSQIKSQSFSGSTGSSGGGGSSPSSSVGQTGQAVQPASSQTSEQVFTVQGLSGGELFTGDTMRELLENIEEASEDGRTRIRVA